MGVSLLRVGGTELAGDFFGQYDVARFGIDDRLLVIVVCAALAGGAEAGAHLHRPAYPRQARIR
jgi:hypothetical protein